jgi:hypothetical protein
MELALLLGIFRQALQCGANAFYLLDDALVEQGTKLIELRV